MIQLDLIYLKISNSPMLTLQTLTYPIVETFHSIQGEGAWAGTNAFFIRLGGCDVYCPWCDQKETWNAKRYPQESAQSLAEQVDLVKPAIAIITGGEPLLYDLFPLTQELRNKGIRTHLETSGAHPFSGNFDWVTFSPKPYKSPHISIYEQASELKVIIGQKEDLQWAKQQSEKISSHIPKYLQPEWNCPDSQQLIFDYILSHPQWRMSLQTHKFLGVR